MYWRFEKHNYVLSFIDCHGICFYIFFYNSYWQSSCRREFHGKGIKLKTFPRVYASVIPPSPSPPPPLLDGKFPGVGSLELSNSPGGDEKRGQMPRPPLTLQHFSLIAQSNIAILSILMCDFLFQLTSSLPWVPEVFSRVRRGASSATGRHVFGRRPKTRGSLFKT